MNVDVPPIVTSSGGRRRIVEPVIVRTDQWGARPPKRPVELIGRPDACIFHHTAGHHPELERPRDESRAELYRYAREIQAAHMAPGGLGSPTGAIDSGHNFLIGRNGIILVGRHQSLPQIRRGLMVHSAHCPGQNRNPGIEHEHAGAEQMTPEQYAASVHLHAWIIDRCRMRNEPIWPHRAFIATACPGTLERELPRLRADVARILGDL